MLLTLLGRLSSDMQAEAIFTGAELRRMRVRARNCGLSERADPASAILVGGNLGRLQGPPERSAAGPRHHAARLRQTSDAGHCQ